jgi:hypothetical protein
MNVIAAVVVDDRIASQGRSEQGLKRKGAEEVAGEHFEMSVVA